MFRHILVIDREDRETFWRTLNIDYKILFASTAQKGLELLSENAGLIFLNLKQPDMNGIEVLKIIKNRYPSTAVIVLAASGTEDTCMEAFRNGARDYVKKPVSAEEAMQKIKIMMAIDRSPDRRQHVSLLMEIDPEQYSHIPAHLVDGLIKVKDYIDQNYSDSLTLTAACKMASMSKTYFCRFFKSVTGHSLRRYYHVVRIRIAEELLRDRRLSITEVAVRIGYSDSNYFSTIYKKINGYPPRDRRSTTSTQTRYELDYPNQYFPKEPPGDCPGRRSQDKDKCMELSRRNRGTPLRVPSDMILLEPSL